MESNSVHQDPDDPRSVLAAADQARQRLAAGLRLPAGLHPALAAAVAVQLGTAAYGIATHTAAGLAVAMAGAAAFLGVAVLALRQFRRVNGVRIDGLASQVVLGTGATSTLVLPYAFGAATWAAFGVALVARRRSVVAGGTTRCRPPVVARLMTTRPPRGRRLAANARRARRVRVPGARCAAGSRLMAQLDPLIHAPARLQLVTTLSAVSEAEFATLQAALEVSDSVLSKHVSALADAGYVRSRKGVQAGRRTTWIGLTSAGREALREHVAALRRLIDMVD
jgi:DNA-binding MarR family transcriptional regulator